MAIIVIGIVAYIIYLIGKTASSKQTTYRSTVKSARGTNQDIVDYVLSTKQSSSTIREYSAKYEDGSIIDVTNRSYDIPKNVVQNSDDEVPYWAHTYVYSFSELQYANNRQKEFYQKFKRQFLDGNCVDLRGNLNYAFILLFDLLSEYDTSKNIKRLEECIKRLSLNYPKTKSYAIQFLTERMEAIGDNEGVLRVISEEGYRCSSGYDNDYWKLGGIVKGKLQLDDQEYRYLNKVNYSENNFCSIEFCLLAIIRLYLNIIKEFNRIYNAEGSTVDKQFVSVADVIARKHFKYKAGSSNYKYGIEVIVNEIYTHIFKTAENVVRDSYGHKRKINTDNYYSATEAKKAFEDKISNNLKLFIPNLVQAIEKPDSNTELTLNAHNTTRWKLKLEVLQNSYEDNAQAFVESVVALGKQNTRNPSVENLFYEASKFISKYDKEAAVTLYVFYLHYDLNSANFDNKQLSKAIQKNLFKTDEQFRSFEAIVSELVKSKDLDKALRDVSTLYSVKRKKIELDKASIQQVVKKHSGTVELLNEYLKDDHEGLTILAQDVSTEEVQFSVSSITNSSNTDLKTTIPLTTIQLETLELFFKSNFSVSHKDIETFCKSRGLLKNQLMESLNESCYELLDDVLIEEEEDLYSVNESYYHKIFEK